MFVRFSGFIFCLLFRKTEAEFGKFEQTLLFLGRELGGDVGDLASKFGFGGFGG